MRYMRLPDGWRYWSSMDKLQKLFDDGFEPLIKHWDTALEHYGDMTQLKKSQEELNELHEVVGAIVNLYKKHEQSCLDNCESKVFALSDMGKMKFVEEAADVLNMIGQLCKMLDVTIDDLVAMMYFKMHRTMSRIKGEED